MVFSSYKIQRVVEFVDESSQPDHSVKTLQHLSDLVEANFIGLAACSGGGGGLHHFVNSKVGGVCLDSARIPCRFWKATCSNSEHTSPVRFSVLRVN